MFPHFNVNHCELVLVDVFWQTYRDKNLDFWFQHVDVMFEKKKREFIPEDSSGIKLPLKTRMEKEYKKETKDDIEAIIEKFNQMYISSRGSDMVIYREAITDLHNAVFDNILSKIEAVLKNTLLKVLKHIIVVGSFAESEILRQKLVERFPKYVILVPGDVSTAVLRGAMMYVYDPDQKTLQQPVKQSGNYCFSSVYTFYFNSLRKKWVILLLWTDRLSRFWKVNQ